MNVRISLLRRHFSRNISSKCVPGVTFNIKSWVVSNVVALVLLFVSPPLGMQYLPHKLALFLRYIVL